MKKKIVCFALIICVALSLAAPAGAVYVDGKNVYGQGLFIMDYETGIELYGYNADTPFVPASITKLMSMYLTYEAVKNGEITMDTQVPVSEKVFRLSRDTNYWNTVPLYYNQTYYVWELIELIFIYSASASVVALAELICGDEQPFVDRMNAKAEEWGIDATFNGCSGIEDNYITPRAVAELSRRLIRDYPQVLDITGKTSLSFHGNTYHTTNHLLTSQYYGGVDGLKSGTTTNAGYCFVATCEIGGVRLITVVMKSANGSSRFTDSKVLLDYGFSVRDKIVREATMKLAPFTDVYIDDWFAGSVSAVSSMGLMKGTTDTTFSPNVELSRAMAVVLLHRLAGSPRSDAEPGFSDAGENDWFTPALSWAVEHEIVSGNEDGSFAPYRPVSRQELALMLFNYARDKGSEPVTTSELEDFSDVDSVAVWAREAMAWAVRNKLINGVGSNLLAPTYNATRAQTASVILRFVDYLAVGMENTEENSEPSGVSDVSGPSEAADAVGEQADGSAVEDVHTEQTGPEDAQQYIENAA